MFLFVKLFLKMIFVVDVLLNINIIHVFSERSYKKPFHRYVDDT